MSTSTQNSFRDSTLAKLQHRTKRLRSVVRRGIITKGNLSARRSHASSACGQSLAQTLPEDVLVEIFLDLKSTEDFSALLSCTLVCRSWSFPSSTIILHNVLIPQDRPEDPRRRAIFGWSKSKPPFAIFSKEKRKEKRTAPDRPKRTLSAFLHALLNSPRIADAVCFLRIEKDVIDFTTLQATVAHIVHLSTLSLDFRSFALMETPQLYLPPTSRRAIDSLKLYRRRDEDASLDASFEPRRKDCMPQVLDVLLWFSECNYLHVGHDEIGDQRVMLNLIERLAAEQLSDGWTMPSGKLIIRHLYLDTWLIPSILGSAALESMVDFQFLAHLVVRIVATDLDLVNRFLFRYGQTLHLLKLEVYAGPVLTDGKYGSAESWPSIEGRPGTRLASPRPPYPFVSICPNLRYVGFSLQFDPITPEVSSACRILWNHYMQDIMAAPALQDVAFGIFLARERIDLDFETDILGTMYSFLGSVDWSLLDRRQGYTVPERSCTLPDGDAQLDTQRFRVSLALRTRARVEHMWMPLVDTEHNELILARVSPRMREILEFDNYQQ